MKLEREKGKGGNIILVSTYIITWHTGVRGWFDQQEMRREKEETR